MTGCWRNCEHIDSAPVAEPAPGGVDRVERVALMRGDLIVSQRPVLTFVWARVEEMFLGDSWCAMTPEVAEGEYQHTPTAIPIAMPATTCKPADNPPMALLTRKWISSGWVKSECGASVWRWSVGVGVYFPASDKPHNPVGRCGDCARITFLVARTRSVWTVWGDY